MGDEAGTLHKCLLVEQKTRKGTFFKLGSAQRCHHLGSENGILVGKG